MKIENEFYVADTGNEKFVVKAIDCLRVNDTNDEACITKGKVVHLSSLVGCNSA